MYSFGHANLWLALLLGALAVSAAFSRGHQSGTSHLAAVSPHYRPMRGVNKISGASNDDSAQPDKGGNIAQTAAKAVAVFYLAMLAPIYGVGFPFLGQMTDFNTVENRPSPNECFVAPAGFLPRAAAQIEAPTYAVTPDELLIKLDYAIRSLDRVDFIAADKDTLRREYVVRSKVFQWPDVVTFGTMPAQAASIGSKYRSTLALHSYSIYGESDLGVNRARAEAILQRLDFSLCGTDPSKSLYCR
jgi:uncharacterized protein (DUF1499 family)